MGLCLSTTSRLRSTERTGKSAVCDSESSLAKQQSPHIVSIHILDDDSLFNIFYIYRPFFLGEDRSYNERFCGGWEQWVQGRWWYKLAHVCQRWRNLILGSASYLGLSLVCTNGTPVENMLAHSHSPHLPLTIDYRSEDGITAEDEKRMLLALQQRHRVRHLRLTFPVHDLRKLVKAIDEEFPILEYLIVYPSPNVNTALMLPETLQAPNLHHLYLGTIACPIQTRLLPTATRLVTLFLGTRHQSTYFQPSVLLQWISFMPQLESLVVAFTYPVPDHDVERELTHTPITTHITLPNLRLFWFQGDSAYLEAVLYRITTPRLENLHIRLSSQLTFSLPRLPWLMNTTENLRRHKAEIMFVKDEVEVLVFFRDRNTFIFGVRVDSRHLDWQVTFMAQLCNTLSQVFSTVDHLTLVHKVHGRSSEEHNNVDRNEWRTLLGSFRNVKTLDVGDGLVEQLSRCLQLEDGEPPLELLPELQELAYSGSGGVGDAFTSFIDSRQNAGRPVSLIRQSSSSSSS